MKLINIEDEPLLKTVSVGGLSAKALWRLIKSQRAIKAIPVEQLLSILPKYDDYIHTKTYPYNETMEDIYSKGHEDGWNVCLKIIKEELEDWEKENEQNKENISQTDQEN